MPACEGCGDCVEDGVRVGADTASEIVLGKIKEGESFTAVTTNEERDKIALRCDA